MLNNVILGTANFLQSYGILSKGEIMSSDDVKRILETAYRSEIQFLDTALAYGDFFLNVAEELTRGFNIITKVSLKDLERQELPALSSCLKNSKSVSVLLHDPHNINLREINKYRDELCELRGKYNVDKVGVSVYDLSEVDLFSEICMPDVIQIPLNPLNQRFVNSDFIDFVTQNKIQVHARSLFLQGVLLSDEIPANLSNIEPHVKVVQKKLDVMNSRLQSLLNWAFKHDWITSWIFGVSSLQDLEGFISAVRMVDIAQAPVLDHVNIPESDPRYWNNA